MNPCVFAMCVAGLPGNTVRCIEVIPPGRDKPLQHLVGEQPSPWRLVCQNNLIQTPSTGAHTHTHKLNYLFRLPTAYKLEMLLPCQLFNFFYQERIINICPNLFSLAFCSQIRRISRVSSHWGGWPLSICPPKTDFCWHLVLGK